MNKEDRNGIVWLASYPKSGNTWFRAFLTALTSGGEPDINSMDTDGIFSGKNHLEAVLDMNADYLDFRQIERFQRIAFTHLAETSKRPLFIKIHDAFTFSETDGQPLIPENCSRQGIYFVRNPLDVTLSLVNHLGKPVDRVIEKLITNKEATFLPQKITPNSQFHQPLGTWSMHVESWLKYPSFPVHIMRYEDMKERPFETFSKAVEALGLEAGPEQIRCAIENTRFEKLQKKEEEAGFREKQIPSSRFFFKGQSGRWKEELTGEQIEKIRKINEPMMRRFGYW
ncbi:sulfotransferase domain-containing protein [Leadbetterella sp. DM7]|uniref:sulfotransferase domain-containing protein n=1 Tax=Leadbetterella sp. DM7 TaxID=3235085 RepID=UPI00349E6D99